MLIEIVGEAGVGKTHMSCGFDNVLFFDCGKNKESEFVFRKVSEDDTGLTGGYVWIREWKDIEEALNSVVIYNTVVFDLSEQLVKMAGREWMRVNKKRAVYPITNYQYVYGIVDKLIEELVFKGVDIVMISGLKDNWVDDKRTGRREHAGYKNLPYQADIRILLCVEDVDGVMKRVGKVVKNRFLDVCSDDYIKELSSCDYKGIMELVKF